MTKMLKSTLIRHWSITFVLHRCLINVNLRVLDNGLPAPKCNTFPCIFSQYELPSICQPCCVHHGVSWTPPAITPVPVCCCTEFHLYPVPMGAQPRFYIGDPLCTTETWRGYYTHQHPACYDFLPGNKASPTMPAQNSYTSFTHPFCWISVEWGELNQHIQAGWCLHRWLSARLQ